MLAWPSWLMAIGNIGNWWNDLMDTSIYRKPCAFLYLKKHTCHNNIKDMRHELSYSWLNCIYFGVYYFYHYHYRYYHHYHYWALLFCFLLSILQLYSFTSLAQSCRPLPVPQHRCNGARHGLFLDSFRLALSKLDIQELLQRPTASKKARRLGARGNWQIFCHRFLFGDVTTLIQCYSWGFDEETDTGSAALCMEHLPTKRNALSHL